MAAHTMTTTALATAVSHAPSVPSARPAAPVASRYDVVPLQAPRASPHATAAAARRARRVSSVHIVAPLERAARRRVLVAEVALPAAVGEARGVRAALRLDVGDHLPDHRRRDRAAPRRHPLRASLEDRLVDVRGRTAVAPVRV